MDNLGNMRYSRDYCLVYRLYNPDSFISSSTAKCFTEPTKKSWLALLEDQLESDIRLTEHLKERLKLLQESGADPEHIDRVHNDLQNMLASLETDKAEIELEKKDIAEAQKHATKVSKQQLKRPRQIDESGKQTTEVPKYMENIPIRKETTEVPKYMEIINNTEVPMQQEKELRLVINNTEVPMQQNKVLEA
ncbi:uncharacterized protein LOC123906892 isoform X1 [Trifolium pratense]|uniref:uncharacterized protein LOC123906892 isoform X1 n=1 Tax=Trifolium pratense TaxID=57577 RepID=UPI001E6921FA|nr:uncharacterized protein LOC123906892 isoform X1 [Trifolium pratense]